MMRNAFRLLFLSQLVSNFMYDCIHLVGSLLTVQNIVACDCECWGSSPLPFLYMFFFTFGKVNFLPYSFILDKLYLASYAELDPALHIKICTEEAQYCSDLIDSSNKVDDHIRRISMMFSDECETSPSQTFFIHV